MPFDSAQHRLTPRPLFADLEVDDVKPAGRELGPQRLFRQKTVDELDLVPQHVARLVGEGAPG